MEAEADNEKTDGVGAVEVELTEQEWLHAYTEGCRMYVENVVRDRKPWFDSGAKALVFARLNGACGERAVAKWLGVPWKPSWQTRRDGDVGPLEVRTAALASDPLRVYERDPDDRVFVLVCGTGPRWQIVGWILGARAKQVVPLTKQRDGRDVVPSHFVPRSMLSPKLSLLRERTLAKIGAGA